MTKNVSDYLKVLKGREYRSNRKNYDLDVTDIMRNASSDEMAEADILSALLEYETPTIYPHDPFGFNMTAKTAITYLSENGDSVWFSSGGNVTPDYPFLLHNGFWGLLNAVNEKISSGHKEEIYAAWKKELETILAFCGEYQKLAKNTNNLRLATALENIMAKAPETLFEACLVLKIYHFFLRSLKFVHLTFGRFDQYMYEFYEHDKAAGVSEDELLETVELFFITLNFDSDMYRGIQKGDNGQSMVLGGYDENGNYNFNGMSRLCMEASLELNLIDPKINLRVGKNTPISLYEYGTRLTAKGLGFPQYCNDDVVVPGLIALGYDKKDAYDYSVAACWEYIPSGCAYDIPNIETMNYPLVVGEAIKENLLSCDTFDELCECVKTAIRKDVDRFVAKERRRTRCAPLLSLTLDGCFENGKDLSKFGAKYNNYGCHGAGLSNAVDSLAAIKKLIYDDKTLDKKELLNALDKNFEGYTELRNKLMECPKMGNNDDFADDISIMILDTFSSYLNNTPNGIGGIWRAGTGSAMEYILSAEKCPATADGRCAGEPYASSFSPSLNARLNGPLSVIKSFTKFDLKNIINGGPLTMEVHDTVFRNEDGYKKTAMLVKSFIDLGGHQLQINAINRDRLIDAQKHPENHPDLIVRVWGWSGYFNELDKKYQDHIIKRTEFTV